MLVFVPNSGFFIAVTGSCALSLPRVCPISFLRFYRIFTYFTDKERTLAILSLLVASILFPKVKCVFRSPVGVLRYCFAFFFAENCLIMKEFEPMGVSLAPPMAVPYHSTLGHFDSYWITSLIDSTSKFEHRRCSIDPWRRGVCCQSTWDSGHVTRLCESNTTPKDSPSWKQQAHRESIPTTYVR